MYLVPQFMNTIFGKLMPLLNNYSAKDIWYKEFLMNLHTFIVTHTAGSDKSLTI